MVYKVCKGGVRSGNTLRGLHTLKTNRYGRHACLIGQSSLSRRGVDELVRSSTNDSIVTDALNSTDVILSLNKRQRWLLPATVRHMITTGSFNPNVMVSMLERHKLKRRANCVNFVCNKGCVRNVHPTEKKYFSFSLNNIDQNESNRQKRRNKAKQLSIMSKQKKNRKDKNLIQTIHTYTESGETQKYDEPYSSSLRSSKPEYRVEVFYPCPKSCSLTFNPKYTDVAIEVNEDGKQVVRHVVNNHGSKVSRRRTKHEAVLRLAHHSEEIIVHDVDEMWYEAWDEEDNGHTCYNQCHHNHSNLEHQEGFVFEDETNAQLSDSLLPTLIAQAEKIRELCSNQHTFGKRKSNHRKNTYFNRDEVKEKSHVVYIEEIKMYNNTEKTASGIDAKYTEETGYQKKDNDQVIDLKFSEVIMSTEECSAKALKDKYGQLYAEADSEPRRFVINVTDDVRNVLSFSRSISDNFTYTSYLVFVHNGIYDEGLDTYRICLNSYVIKDSESSNTLAASLLFAIYSLGDILNNLFGALLDLKLKGRLEIVYSPQIAKYNPGIDFITERMAFSYEAFHTTQEISRTSLTDSRDFSTRMSEAAAAMDENVFCDICYENVNPSQLDNIPGTKLKTCAHMFCDKCWRAHVYTKVRDGAVNVICPGYDCDVEVGLVTLLTVAPATEVGQLLQRRCEGDAEVSPNFKWCPNIECGRVIRLQTPKDTSSLTYDVRCLCGHRICFACLCPAHWPASCEQAEDYTDKLFELKPPNETDNEVQNTKLIVETKKEKLMELDGRLCPNCSRFIEKYGGCPMMICKCGKSFCWKCMQSAKEGYHNPSTCVENVSTIYRYARKVVVHHVKPVYLPKSLDNNKKSESVETKPSSARHRTSLYQRALQHRLDGEESSGTVQSTKCLVKKIAAICSKNAAFKREVLSLCGLGDIPEKELATLSPVPHVTRFLESCKEMRRALLHVAEFSFVLLHDTPTSVEKCRALRVANDLSAYCSFFRSVLDCGDQQDGRAAVRRLANIKQWAGRAIDTLLDTVKRLDNKGSVQPRR